MRSAPCAWAPSHTLHAMPPRITRNSHRPRASDRTMVDLEHQFGLPLFRTRWHRHHPRRKLMSMGNRPSFSREAQLQWAGSRETNLASGRGRTFFLTSLFIELIDAGVQSAHGLLETNCGRTVRFRSHLSLLSHLDSYEGHISRSGTRNNWFDRSGRRRDLCLAFTCLLGTVDFGSLIRPSSAV